MPYFYAAYDTCGHDRMALLGTSSETFGEPSIETERYYRCKRGHEWTLAVEHYVLRPGVPADYALRLHEGESR